ncbi:UNVERIFIED_CONTAM: two-component system LytT family response regulator [Brevibacillus sp. OAP136]
MFNVVIVEDEMPILELMKYVIGQNRHYRIVGAFTNPFEALECLRDQQPDVAFLDIEMPRMNGLELAQKVNELLAFTKIVFTTAYANYALDAFRVYAFDYILKPITPTAIERLANRLLLLQTHAAPVEQKGTPVSISCFGGFEVRDPTGALVRWPTRKTEELLAFLLCHFGQDISKWHLIDLLWSDMTVDRAAHNLHNTMYRLKKILKECEIEINILKTIDGYTVESVPCEYDVQLFQKYEAAASDEHLDVEKAEQLCALYKGLLLEKKDYLWKVPLEVAFSKQYEALTRRLIDHDLVKGEWKSAEKRLSAFLTVYPLHEEMNMALLQIYTQCGYLPKAEKLYSQLESAYRRELGVDLPWEVRNWMQKATEGQNR